MFLSAYFQSIRKILKIGTHKISILVLQSSNASKVCSWKDKLCNFNQTVSLEQSDLG